jgi:hypothetical protein
MSTTRKCLVVIAAVGLLLLWANSTMALVAMWNVDIHQNKFTDYANDFHVWGQLESGLPDGSNPPTLITSLAFQETNGTNTFNNFSYSITPSGPPWYSFNANWSNPDHPIPYCTWWHYGLDFDETCHNIGYNIHAAWTRNGIDPGYSPMYGFEVRDGILTAEPQKITIQNYSYVDTSVLQMQLLVLQPPEVQNFPLANLNTSFFDTHPEWMSRFVSVPTAMLPSMFAGTNSFFDVYLDSLGLTIPPGGGLIAREYSSYQGGSTDYFWNYELHGAHMPEPGTLVLLLSAGIALSLTFRRRRRSV